MEAGNDEQPAGRGVQECLLPLFLKLQGRKVVLVGAGTVAVSKLSPLVAAGADVTVVAPEIAPAIEAAATRIVRRPFEPADLDGAWLAVAAAPAAVNRRVAAAAESRRVFVNAVDDPVNASAYAGGVLRRGGVTIAISTTGRAPGLAGLLREAFDALLPAEIDQWLADAEHLRGRWIADGVPMAERRPLLLRALNQLYEAKLR